MIAGIDLSTWAIDIVTIGDDSSLGPVDGWTFVMSAPQHHRFPLEGQDAWERARNVRDTMPGRTAEFWDDVHAIAVEDPRGYNAGRLFRIQGAIVSCLPPDILIHPYVPARWRVLAGLKGHALKAEVAQRSLELGAPDGWPQDAHDAHLIARALQNELDMQKAA